MLITSAFYCTRKTIRLKLDAIEAIAMNVQMIFFIFALFLAPQQPMRGSIEGRVLNALNGQPLAGAQVSAAPGPAGLSDVVAGRLSAGAINSIPPQGATVIRSTSSAGTTPSSGPTITTGNDGKFFFTDLGPGTYRVTVSANGYATQQYGQLGPNLSGRPITITAAGEQINNIVIALSPAAAVTGQITDENGQPAVDVPVQLLHVLYNPQGKFFNLSRRRPRMIGANIVCTASRQDGTTSLRAAAQIYWEHWRSHVRRLLIVRHR
jgi:Carboxypeptidase regulatory-like domain